MIGKGIEPHPTDGYHSVSFLTTLKLMERPLFRHLSCRVDQVGSQVLSQPNITIISKLDKNVKFFSILFLFYFTLRATRRVTESSKQPVRWCLLHLHSLQEFITSPVEFLPVFLVIILRVKPFIRLQ